MLAVSIFEPESIAGLASLITVPLTLVAVAWAITRTSLVKVEREGRVTATQRLHEANGWNTELEKMLAKRTAHLQEKDQLVTSLEERIASQKEHLDKMLERTPEKLWEAVERHAREASAEWVRQNAARDEAVRVLGERLEEILARLESIGREVRAVAAAGRGKS